MKTREGTLDEYVIKEQEGCYGKLNFKDKVVLDLGANIGAFADFAIKHGAKQVFCYEPEDDNFRLLEENTKGLNVECFKAAVIGGHEKEMDFNVNTLKNKGAHSLYISRGRVTVKVKCVNFYEICEQHKPEILKIDIEGGEYHIFKSNVKLQESIEQIAIELHFGTKEWRKVGCFKVLDYLGYNQFNMIRKPKIGGKNWTTMLIARRY